MVRTSDTHKIRRSSSRYRGRVAVLLIASFVVAGFCPPLLIAQSGGVIQLNGFLDVPTSTFNTDVWGWVDPSTQIEYALVGNNATGLHIVDMSDPANPVITGTIDSIPSFDMKTWMHYVYTVDGNYGFVGQDGRITDISDPKNPVVVGSIPAGHNIFVDHLGFMYLTFPGLKIYDLNTDPTNPELVWEKASTEGHDVTVIGDMLYDFHGHDGTFIYDIKDRSRPRLLGSITDPSITFHHSGWTSADERFLFINDEFALHPEPDIIVFDIKKPSVASRVAEISDPDATAHNSYRIGDYLYVSYYTAGFRVFDITDPRFPFLSAEFDTTPLTGEGIFKGAWGCYPFSPSGHIYINDRPNGFFVFDFNPSPTGVIPSVPASFVLNQNYPNPFNPETIIPYELNAGGHVALRIYDVTGRMIRTLVDEYQSAGEKTVTWAGRDGAGHRVASGVFFYRLSTDRSQVTRKMVLAE